MSQTSESVADVLTELQADLDAQRRAHETWAAQFQCPDPTGVTAPCLERGDQFSIPDKLLLEDLEHGPVVWISGPGRSTIACPAAARLDCQPLGRVKAAMTRARHTAWLQSGRALGIPKRYLLSTFESVERTPAVVRTEAFLKTEAPDGRCLVLLGPTGSGKSTAAACGLRAWPRRGARFVFFPSWVGDVLSPSRRDEALEESKRASLLVLDDLSADGLKAGGLAAVLLDELIWHRESEELATIITSNITVEVLREQFSDRVVDRLAGSWGSVFQAAGPSLRRSS